MIKGTYFSKSLKLFLFGFLISCFMVLGNSVSAAQTHQGLFPIGGTYASSQLNNQFNVTALKRGKFLTNYLGYTKPIFALGDKSLVFWNYNKLYLFDSYSLYNGNCGTNVVQGYFTKVFACPVITGDFLNLNNCGSALDYSEELVSNFLNSVVPGDWGLYRRTISNDYYCRNWEYNYVLCLSSQSLNRSLCFITNHHLSNGWQGSLGENIQLSSSTSYGNIDLGLLMDPPGWGSSSVGTLYASGNYCPTIKDILNGFDSKYTTGYCYGNVFESGQVHNYFIQDIFSSFSDFQNSFSNFSAYCHAPYTQEYCMSMLGGNSSAFALDSKIYNSQYEFNLKDLWNYCGYTTLPLNSTTCVAQSGGVSEPLTYQELLQAGLNQPSNLVVPASNSIVGNVLGTGATDLSNINIIDSIYGLYSRFTSFFTQQTGNSSGALPTYIISFLLVIILFRLFKK